MRWIVDKVKFIHRLTCFFVVLCAMKFVFLLCVVVQDVYVHHVGSKITRSLFANVAGNSVQSMLYDDRHDHLLFTSPSSGVWLISKLPPGPNDCLTFEDFIFFRLRDSICAV